MQHDSHGADSPKHEHQNMFIPDRKKRVERQTPWIWSFWHHWSKRASSASEHTAATLTDCIFFLLRPRPYRGIVLKKHQSLHPYTVWYLWCVGFFFSKNQNLSHLQSHLHLSSTDIWDVFSVALWKVTKDTFTCCILGNSQSEGDITCIKHVMNTECDMSVTWTLL